MKLEIRERILEEQTAAERGEESLIIAAQVEEIHRGLWDFAQEWVGLEQRLGLCLPISGRDAYGPMLEVFGGENAPYRRGLEGLFDEPGIG